MKCKYSLFVLVLLSGTAQSQGTTQGTMQGTTMNELERKLILRDEAIIELLERVESLEQRIGVQRRTRNATESSKQDDTRSAEKELVQAPGAVVVEEGDAERALERSLTLEGALLLPSGVMEIESSLAYTRREDRAPGFVTVGSQVFPSEIELNANSLTANMFLRLGLPWESQLEIGVPYRWSKVRSVTNINFVATDTAKQSSNDLGDLSIGFAKTLLREELWLPDIVGRLTWDTDTGDADSFKEIRGSLTAIKRQDPVTFIGGASYQYASKNELTKPGAVMSANFGSLIALSPETSMRFIITATHQSKTQRSGLDVIGSDRTVASFVIGGSTLLARGTLFNLSVAIGLTDDADDFSITMSLPVRLDERVF